MRVLQLINMIVISAGYKYFISSSLHGKGNLILQFIENFIVVQVSNNSKQSSKSEKAESMNDL